MNEYRSMPSQLSHKESELEKHVVSERSMPLASHFDDVVGLSDRNRKIGLTHCFFQRFKRIPSCEENPLAPCCTENIMLQLCLYFAGDRQSLGGRDDEELWIFVGRRDKVVPLEQSPR